MTRIRIFKNVDLVERWLESKGYNVIVLERDDYSLMTTNASRMAVDCAIDMVNMETMTEDEWLVDTRLGGR
jgi:hypothetical protein